MPLRRPLKAIIRLHSQCQVAAGRACLERPSSFAARYQFPLLSLNTFWFVAQDTRLALALTPVPHSSGLVGLWARLLRVAIAMIGRDENSPLGRLQKLASKRRSRGEIPLPCRNAATDGLKDLQN